MPLPRFQCFLRTTLKTWEWRENKASKRAGGGWARIISMPKISSFKQLYDYAGGINFIFSDSHTLVGGGGKDISRLAYILLLSYILIIYH